jgi:hypothetical protein
MANAKRTPRNIIKWPADRPLGMMNVRESLKHMVAEDERRALPKPADDPRRRAHVQRIVQNLIPQAGHVTKATMRQHLKNRTDIQSSIDRATHPTEWEKARKFTSKEIEEILDRVWSGQV